MASENQQILDDLRTEADATHVKRALWRMVDQGDVARVESLFAELRALPPTPILDDTMAAIQSALAMHAQPQSAEAAVRALAGAGASQVRVAAAQLAASQSRDTLLRLFSHADDHPELFACLMQEMALRGHSPEQSDDVKRAHSKLSLRHHPLAWLPLQTLDPERAAASVLRKYGRDSSTAEMPFGPSGTRRTRVGELHPPQPTLHAQPVDQNLSAAVRNWQQESSAKVEMKVLQSNRVLDDTELCEGLLLHMQLDCLQGISTREIHLRRAGCWDVFPVLLAAAANGGALNTGHEGAYGRLAAWQSLAALAGVPPDARFDGVHQAAASCRFGLFDAKSAWFAQVAWDLGVVAVRPGAQFVALLAATDTD